MKIIDNWLKQFMTAWKAHDIDKVLILFADNVEYWETPFKKLLSFNELRTEWESVKNQKNINISCEVFSKDGNKYSVNWELKYIDSNKTTKILKGVYLIKLNSDNKCSYFFHCGELKI